MGCAGIDLQIRLHLDHRTGGFDETALPCHRGRGIECAAHDGIAGHHVGDQSNFAFFTGGQGLGANHAGVVDRGPGQAVHCTRSQEDLAPIGPDCPLVFDQGIERALLHLQLDRTTQVEGDHGTCAHEHGTTIGHGRAFVDHTGRQQGDHAALAGIPHGRDLTLVDDGIGGSARKTVIARHEVLGAHVQGRGHQGPHIDLGRGREQHAVGVEQENLAVGIDRALDDRHIRAQHPVQGHGAGARLDELDGFALADRETLPVDGHAGGGLIDRQGLQRLTDAALTGHHLAALRQVGRQGPRCGHAEHTGQGFRRTTGFTLATAAGHLAHNLPNTQCTVPDHAINVIHNNSRIVFRNTFLLFINKKDFSFYC